ncbi:hypothetical protein BGX38DRAFT_227126 [Terfezia claveryi]|nr:hypothetical protein BGX38DRAFT_227126 [Terfezia claveryi]
MQFMGNVSSAVWILDASTMSICNALSNINFSYLNHLPWYEYEQMPHECSA